MDTTDAAVYEGWYQVVYIPAAAPKDVSGNEEG